MFFKRTILLAIHAIVFCLAGESAFAQTPPNQHPQDKPAAFSADNMTHDKALGVITARGHVEINQNDRTLYADVINYDQNHDIIRANGHVTLHRSNGDVVFSDNMEISGDLKNALIDNIRAVLNDKSRLAAGKATLVNDETMTLDRVIYTRCEACITDPGRAPLWQIKSVKVIHDKVNKIVEYQDSWLEIAGVPVVYMPYLSHPDPTVKRKSGFLSPSFGGSSTLGMKVQAPYFYVLDKHSDVTLTPIVTTNENGAIAGQYRNRFTKGELQTDASLAYDSKQNVMGHIDASANFDINQNWRWGADLKRASDDTYMRRYGFGGQDTLTSKTFLEGFHNKTYTSISALLFQGLRNTDNAKTTPYVLPNLAFNHQGDPNKLGAYNAVDVNIAMLTRDQGVSSRRVSVNPSWNLPYIAPKGDIYKLSASMGVDFFHAQNQPAPAVRGSIYNGAALRVMPQIALDWKWPLARRTNTVTEIIEPIGQFIVSPYGGNSYKMANEDSIDFDFNDANLFSTNRFTGYDRVESGPRANYGLKWSVTGDGGGATSVLVGQSYRLKKDDTFKIGSGLENNFSDYVAKIQSSPNEHFKLLYRTRLGKKKLNFRRNELGVNGSAGWFSYGANYSYFAQQQDSEFAGRKEFTTALGAKLTNRWSSSFNSVSDLAKNGGLRSMHLGLTYDDECFRMDTTLGRTFFRDRDIKPNNSIMFRLVFKTLGEVASDVAVN